MNNPKKLICKYFTKKYTQILTYLDYQSKIQASFVVNLNLYKKLSSLIKIGKLMNKNRNKR